MKSVQASIEEEIATVSIGAPHLVILGAGASRAACPAGDANGQLLPLMADLATLPGVAALLGGARSGNFEEIYSSIASDSANAALRQSLEAEVRSYFASLRLPDMPTIYDHLVLSLRPKDVIATFNWDPFLIQAVRRNPKLAEGGYPRLVFLHGNVLAGYCEADKIVGTVGTLCGCGKIYPPSRLLYPVAEKDYQSEPMISAGWKFLEGALKKAFMVTVFGYSAPISDVGAIEILKKAWGTPEERHMEQFEIIDIRPEDDLRESWDPFIHTHHYEIHSDYFSSFIATHPRRTGEAYWNQFVEGRFTTPNPAHQASTVTELADWFRPLLEAEAKSESGAEQGSGAR